MYRDYIKPRHRIILEAQRKYFPEPFFVWFHSCGSIYDLLPDFIDLGIEVINPVQLTAKGMDARKIKREYGKDLTFWGGGVNTQEILPRGGMEEVKTDVAARIQALAPEGGYIFNTVHNIQDDVPLENILAMFEAFESLRDMK
jgi:uroporphyrinogen decarboxylase